MRRPGPRPKPCGPGAGSAPGRRASAITPRSAAVARSPSAVLALAVRPAGLGGVVAHEAHQAAVEAHHVPVRDVEASALTVPEQATSARIAGRGMIQPSVQPAAAGATMTAREARRMGAAAGASTRGAHGRGRRPCLLPWTDPSRRSRAEGRASPSSPPRPPSDAPAWWTIGPAGGGSPSSASAGATASADTAWTSPVRAAARRGAIACRGAGDRLCVALGGEPGRSLDPRGCIGRPTSGTSRPMTTWRRSWTPS